MFSSPENKYVRTLYINLWAPLERAPVRWYKYYMIGEKNGHIETQFILTRIVVCYMGHILAPAEGMWPLATYGAH